MYRQASIRGKFIILFGLIALTLSLSGGIKYLSVRHAESAWQNYLLHVHLKRAYLTQIEQNLGYGGAIHHFKNYVLRGDQIYYQNFFSDYSRITAGIEAYRSLDNVSKIELEALAQIDSVARRYRAHIEQVKALHLERHDISGIDSIVAIDDAPAVSGFRSLQKLYSERTTFYNQELTSKILSANRVMVYGLLISLTGLFLSFLIISRSISIPIGQLTKAVSLFASGDFSTRLSIKNRDELGTLGAGFNKMAEEVSLLFNTLKKERTNIKKSEKFLQEISSIAKIGGWEMKLDGQEVAFSKEGARIFGINKRKQVPYPKLLSFFPDHVRSKFAEKVESSIKTGESWELELEARNVMGKKLWIKNVGKLDSQKNRLIGIVQNITERKKAELELLDVYSNVEKLHSELQSIIDSTTDAIAAIDTSFHYIQLNDAFLEYSARIYGIHLKPGMPVPFEAKGLANHEAFWQRALDGESFSEVLKSGELNLDGEAFEIAFNPIRNDQNEIIGAVKIIRDVTDRVRKDMLKDQFVSAVNHELRTPLTAIKGALALINMESAGEIPECLKPMLDIASRNTERLEHLVADLLDAQQIAEASFSFDHEVIHLPDVLSTAVENCQSYARQKGVQLELQHPVADASIYVDKHRFLQIMDNLISNACKFSHPESLVQITTHITNERVLIDVIDEGIGIPASFQPHVFDRFRQSDGTTSRNHEGTGLGLYISSRLTEKLDGQLTFESTEGEGTTFTASFPVVEAEVLA